MKKNPYKYLTAFLPLGLVLGALAGVAAWIFTGNGFCISAGAGIGMLAGVVIGTLADHQSGEKE